MSQSTPIIYQPHPQTGTGMTVQVAENQSDYNFVKPVYGDVSVMARCPHCKHNGFTRIERSVGVSTWMVCLALTFFCAVPCNFYPFCIPQCKDVLHRCSGCGFTIAKKTLFAN